MPSILDRIVAKKARGTRRFPGSGSATGVAGRDSRATAPPRLSGRLARRRHQPDRRGQKGVAVQGPAPRGFPTHGTGGTYSGNGAAAISVITDSHFLGEPAHLTAVKESGASGSAPVLRKDFLFDPYQVYEARAIGADTYLLIVDILSPSQLAELIQLGSELGMTPLVETHDAEEIATAVAAGAEVIGINNRDLHTFVTDLATTESLAPLIPIR